MVKSSSVGGQLTVLEQEALRRAIASIESATWRDALMEQVNALYVTSRTEKTMGYYVDFKVPTQLRIDDLPDEFNKNRPQVEARHPDGVNALFFAVYFKSGTLAFMEAASTSDWPEDEGRVIFAG